MQVIAVKKLDFTFSDVKSLLAVHRENHIMMNFELLNRWKNMNSINSRQVHLYSLHKIIEIMMYTVRSSNFNSIKQKPNIKCTGRARLIRSHSWARFCFELSGNSN